MFKLHKHDRLEAYPTFMFASISAASSGYGLNEKDPQTPSVCRVAGVRLQSAGQSVN
jgi:hypothetical protein